MKKVALAAFAAMVLVTGSMAKDVNANDYIENAVFDVRGYFKAKDNNNNKEKVSESELLLRLVMMKEALKNAESIDDQSMGDGIVLSAARVACGGVAQRLNATYGSYENMNISQQEIKAGVVNMRQSWGHLCWASASQYRFDGWREYNFEKAMWGQAYSMAATERLMANKIKERILEGDKLDPNYVKNQPIYKSLKILYPLENPRSNLKQKIILGYAVNSIDNVEGNLFENVIGSAMANHEPWRISQFVNNPRDFIADMKKNPVATKYYNYMSTQMKDPDLLLDKIKESFKVEEEKRLSQIKAEQEVKDAQVKAETDRKLAQEQEYQKRLPQIKSELLVMRKKATTLACYKFGNVGGIDNDLDYCKKAPLCYRRIDIRDNTYVFPFTLEKSLFGEYKAKIYKGRGILVSQCHAMQETVDRDKILFSQFENLPLAEKNNEAREYLKTQKYKTDSDNWNLDHPLWGEYDLTPSDIEYAERQIAKELNKNEK